MMKINFRKPNIRLTALALAVILFLSTLVGCKPIISLNEIPDYSGKAYVEINGGDPFFKENEITDRAYESYSDLDALGRCGVAVACLGIELMPTEDRESIASITPTGWEYGGMSNNNTYDFVPDNYVYNRCHLIGFQLAGENDNEKNLRTGTRYMNIEGMLPFENQVAEYIEDTGNHVMYRVTPIYNGLDYVARGVLMEAISVEDNGRGIRFCIYAYNVQPGVTIDYFTGVNVANGEALPEINTDEDNRQDTIDSNKKPEGSDSENGENTDKENEKPNDGEYNYVYSKNSTVFHLPGKKCAETIYEENRVYFNGTREELIADGYKPCQKCNP